MVQIFLTLHACENTGLCEPQGGYSVYYYRGDLSTDDTPLIWNQHMYWSGKLTFTTLINIKGVSIILFQAYTYTDQYVHRFQNKGCIKNIY